MSREFRPGEVIAYPYLWAGNTSAVRPKDESTSVSSSRFAARVTGRPTFALFAITTQPPQTGRLALQIPEIERQRAGLGDLKQSWIVVDEYNYDIAERSWYIEPGQAMLGRFSKSFLMKVVALFAEARGKSGRQVSRSD